MPRKHAGCPIERLFGVGDLLLVDAKDLTCDGLMPHLERQELAYEARNVWIAHPNLHMSAQLLLGWISDQWPSQVIGSGRMAGFSAVEVALNEVRIGLASREDDTRQVIANFHKGLVSVADDIASFAAWGCVEDQGMFAWRPFEDGRLVDWVKRNEFDSVAFSHVDQVDVVVRDGIAWKMRAAIASARDLGQLVRVGA